MKELISKDIKPPKMWIYIIEKESNLKKEQIEMLETLQKVDIGLLVAFPNYEDRKRHLEWYKAKLKEDK